MKNCIIVICFLCIQFTLSAQVRHEIKVPVFDLLAKSYQSTYELITMNEKLGFEVGAGFNNSKINLYQPDDYSNVTTHQQRNVRSSASIKYYISKERKTELIGLYFGPTAEFSRITFLEDNFFERQEELALQFPEQETNFVGQKEWNAGLTTGVRYIHKSKFLFNVGLRALAIFSEQPNGGYQHDGKLVTYDIKIGYRFGKAPGHGDLK